MSSKFDLTVLLLSQENSFSVFVNTNSLSAISTCLLNLLSNSRLFSAISERYLTLLGGMINTFSESSLLDLKDDKKSVFEDLLIKSIKCLYKLFIPGSLNCEAIVP